MVALVAGAMSAQSGPAITTSPARPRPGTLFEVHVASGPADEVVSAQLVGEPLHFERDGTGWRAFAAAPADSSSAVNLRVVRCRRIGVCDSTDAVVPLSPSTYRVEKLSVAPKFGREPDSATAQRMAMEFAEARAVSVRAHRTERLWSEPFALPRVSRLTSVFGNAREFNGAITNRHTGVDFAGAIGAAVKATNRGVVRLVGDQYLAGRAIYVDHGAGFVTAYFHLSRVDVLVGDTVARGQIIGGVGASGRVTGPHLHWVARYGQVSFDAMTLPGLPRVEAAPVTPKSPRAVKARAPSRGSSRRVLARSKKRG
jgi:murein DD-endopeptidase MepM/ murein hydrolase activator NlpD